MIFENMQEMKFSISRLFFNYSLIISFILLMIIGCQTQKTVHKEETIDSSIFDFDKWQTSTPSQKKNQVKGIVLSLWNKRKNGLQSKVLNSLSAGKTVVLYNFQDETTFLTNWAFSNKEYLVVDEVIEIYLSTLKFVTTSKFISMKIGRNRKDLTLKENCSYWQDSSIKSLPKIELLLNSSQYMFGAAKMLNNISQVIPNNRTSKMKLFLEKFSSLVLNNHYLRWTLGNTKFFQVKSWGCDKGYYNHFDFLKKKDSFQFHSSKNLSYCNAITDVDLWIVAGVSEILSAVENAPEYFKISVSKKSQLKNYAKFAIGVLESRTKTSFEKNTVYSNFDIGAWDDHPDHANKGDLSEEFRPTNRTNKSTMSSWDIGHARRFVHVFQSLFNNRDLLNNSFPNEKTMEGFANQFYYKIFNGDFSNPLFANFFDGQNGWYRRNYKNRKKFGYGPSQRSNAFIFGGYGIWKRYNPKIENIQKSVWNMLNDQSKSAFRAKYYNSFGLSPDNKLINLIQYFTTL